MYEKVLCNDDTAKRCMYVYCIHPVVLSSSTLKKQTSASSLAGLTGRAVTGVSVSKTMHLLTAHPLTHLPFRVFKAFTHTHPHALHTFALWAWLA